MAKLKVGDKLMYCRLKKEAIKLKAEVWVMARRKFYAKLDLSYLNISNGEAKIMSMDNSGDRGGRKIIHVKLLS